MRVITCCKAVPEAQDIVVTKDRQISIEKAEWKFGQYDLNAVEAGKQIVEAVGGQLSGLCAGGKILDNSKLRKDILSRGLDDLYVVMDEKMEQADTYQSAKVLEAAIQKMGDFDLVLCGAGSSDLYAQQVGNQLGELLGLPVVNAVNKITPEGDKIIVERTVENAIQVLEISLPAVFSVTSEINVPRIAGMKDIIAANKKSVSKFTLSEINADNLPNSSSEILSTMAPEQVDRRLNILEGESDEVIDAFVKLLSAELK
ncbi:electron transfer flavoprotein [Desulfitobacterium sp.]|uniref:electron transfer flavoprotein n=1 Tax=Desulfitobacterium sp. TaxID=49981 RepID=UPI002B1F6DED|nr:electron transfer flavoprotein [Desulfitobacterium sp.]MEA4901397.1 electron transfer flavoprotein [Desulfitobacterium sp.]